jgi:P27 family predicted phage terminase small subunit
MGRTPSPTQLKVLSGNPGKRPIPTNEPKPVAASPDPPAHLQGEALAEWRLLAPELARLGLLTVADRPFLSIFCEAWSAYRVAAAIVAEQGPLVKSAREDGAYVKNPACQVMRDQADVMLRYGSRFGLSPADRVRLAVPTDDDPGLGDAAGILS